jgi:hypothetical protein
MTPEFHRDDQWWVSPFNVTDEVRRSFSGSWGHYDHSEAHHRNFQRGMRDLQGNR